MFYLHFLPCCKLYLVWKERLLRAREFGFLHRAPFIMRHCVTKIYHRKKQPGRLGHYASRCSSIKEVSSNPRKPCVAAPPTSEWSTILQSTKMRLKLEVWRYIWIVTGLTGPQKAIGSAECKNCRSFGKKIFDSYYMRQQINVKQCSYNVKIPHGSMVIKFNQKKYKRRVKLPILNSDTCLHLLRPFIVQNAWGEMSNGLRSVLEGFVVTMDGCACEQA